MSRNYSIQSSGESGRAFLTLSGKPSATAAARATLQKDKRVTIRMSEHDLNRFRKAALRDGLPYQTLIASILHKYILRQ